MTHLTREELQRWWEHGDPADRDRIVNHLALCDECGARYAQVIDSRLVADADRQPVAPELVARGYRAYRPRRRWLAAAWTPGRLATAAAAVLLIAVSIPMLREAPPPIPDGGIRGASLQPLAPIGAIAPPVRFEWDSPVRAARFIVEVRDAGPQPLVVLSTDTPHVELPPDELAQITPGETYEWEVVALDEDGSEIMRGPPRRFHLVSATR